ncbi:MAG: hypothetical protein ABIV51_07785 [Saprospiraceae bacterium]
MLPPISTKQLLGLILFFSIFILNQTALISQDSPRKLIVFEMDLSEYSKKVNKSDWLSEEDKRKFIQPNALNTISSQLVNTYSSNPDFLVINKGNAEAIKKIQEKQGIAAHVDSNLIAEGKAGGADLLMYPKYLVLDNSIVIRVFDVKTGLLTCEASVPIDDNKVNANHTSFYTGVLIQQLNDRCFDVKYSLVRATKLKGESAKEVLIAVGNRQKVKRAQFLEVYQMVYEEVDGKKTSRSMTIGLIEIVKVEDDNFSLAEVKKGEVAIQKALLASTPLFCKLNVNIR